MCRHPLVPRRICDRIEGTRKKWRGKRGRSCRW